ncbi:MAG TPA: hypothetical protein VFY61_16045 [Pyrinomonadaceae bacterium]|nr:hypothetical protein [Pyrinomonadaceae bacterium]
MKRCPQCLFIFPESDARCDFDNTLLVVVDDAEIESAASGAAAPAPAAAAATATAAAKNKRTSASKKRSAGSKKGARKKGAAITALVGFLVFGLAGLFVYSGLSSRGDEVAEIPPVTVMSMTPVAAPLVASPSVATVSSPDPAASSPTPLPRDATERTATSHSRTTVAPVSTSGPGMGKKLGGKPSILLTSGGKIEADEVWRTRDGVWYRRAGIVTLLKHNRVKAIVNQ